MKKVFLGLALFFISTIIISAQNPTDDDVVKISTTLIQIDVSVTDKDGKQITDLKPEDFEVLENGQKQEITNFSYIAVTNDVRKETQNQVTVNSKQVKIPPVPTTLRPDQVRRTIVLVVDDIGMAFASFMHVRDTLKKFVDEQMQEGDLVAIIRTSIGVSVFQQFSSDKRVLRMAIGNLKWNAASGKLSLFPRVEQAADNAVEESFRNASEGFNKQVEDERIASLAAGSLGAMRYVIKGLDQISGRKSVILFSEGFDIFEGTPKQKNSSAVFTRQAMDSLIETANRAGVVINTIDARGLVNQDMFVAEDDLRGREIIEMDAIQQGRRENFRESQLGLSYISEATGGRTFLNTNGLLDSVKKATNDQNGYYLIAYQPDSDTFDANKRKFNKLTVRVKREGAKVRYRSGFFGVTDEKLSPTKQVAVTPQQRMTEALFSPFGASGVSLRITSIFGNDATAGNFVRGILHIDGKTITFADEPNGNKKMSFDIIAYTFDEDGKVADNFGKSYEISVKAEDVQKHIENGLIYSMFMPIKKAGAYQLRVAVRDTSSDRIGAATQFIEIPNLEKNRLSLSGLVLQNMSIAQWQDRRNKKQPTGEIKDAQTVTATRVFRRDSVLSFNYVVYNAKPDANLKTQIQTQARLYRDGELVFEGKLQQLNSAGQTDLKRLEASGAVILGKDLVPGDYVLQVVAVDALAKEKNQVQAQFIDFELID